MATLEGYDWEQAFYVSKLERVLGADLPADLQCPTLADVEDVFGSSEGENEGANWVACGRLKSGLFFFVDAGCDYTGWDCQAGGSVYVADTKERLLQFGIDPNTIIRMGLGDAV